MSDRALIVRRDPRAVKQARRDFRRALIALMGERLQSRRCWWTWPFGHDFGRGWITTSPARSVTCCKTCGRPYSWASFDAYDVWRFARDSDLLSESEYESWDERWSDVP